MAILCVRIASNSHPTDPALDQRRTQPGDVVCIVGDGHVFSAAERNCGQYRFITVPGVSQAELTHLIEPVLDADGTVLRRYTVSLDEAVLRAGAWRTRTSATKAQIAAITRVRA